MAKNNMVCPKCGGTMEIDEDNDIKKCPYCGYSEPLKTDDNTIVKLAKLYERSSQRHEENLEKAEKEGLVRTRKQNDNLVIAITVISFAVLIILAIFG